jgi:hypothetical protein
MKSSPFAGGTKLIVHPRTASAVDLDIGANVSTCYEPKNLFTQTRFRYYFDWRDVDALYAELKPTADELPRGDVQGPAGVP